jgi:hypothetical protein
MQLAKSLLLSIFSQFPYLITSSFTSLENWFIYLCEDLSDILNAFHLFPTPMSRQNISTGFIRVLYNFSTVDLVKSFVFINLIFVLYTMLPVNILLFIS